MQMELFAPAIFTLLRRSTPEELSEILEISEGLEHRIYDAAFQTETLDDLCTAIKSRRYTYTRIQRTLCHLLLNMKQDMNFTAPQYIRILGFNETGQKLLKEMKKTAPNFRWGRFFALWDIVLVLVIVGVSFYIFHFQVP